MKYVTFYKWDPVARNYNLIEDQEERTGELKPSDLDSIMLTETGVHFYLKKWSR